MSLLEYETVIQRLKDDSLLNDREVEILDGVKAQLEQPVTLTRDDLLILLVEECAEVIQATTKAQRFGFDHHQREYGVNKDVLAHEIGQLLAIIDALTPELDPVIMRQAREQKIAKALHWKKLIARRK